MKLRQPRDEQPRVENLVADSDPSSQCKRHTANPAHLVVSYARAGATTTKRPRTASTTRRLQAAHVVDKTVHKLAHTTVRVSGATRDLLRRLAAQESTAMQEVLERALEGYRRRRFLEDVNAGYASLRADRRAWSGVQAERRTWDATVADGLLAEPPSPAAQRRRRRARAARVALPLCPP